MPISRYFYLSVPAIAALLLLGVPIQAQAPPPDAGDAAQELTRGPIHEGFGQPTVFDPQAGPVSPKAPPEVIEELPPDQKPEGDNVVWISGYWQWDDEGKSHVWVSGFWRAVPPGRTWVGGYWNKADEGYQWVSGYWAVERATDVEYLPPPPATLESGPSTESIVEGQHWIPGCWVWNTRYVWRPGFWTAANPNWLWVPANYVWSPGGYVFVEGYWDYPLASRGLLFAPVTFTAYRPGFVYTPTVVLDTRFLTVALFSRPRYHHYYFGDYYANTYVSAGIYPWFSFHMSRHGYDPLFAHTQYIYGRNDAQWTTQLRETYVYRRETVTARPPHTYRAYADWSRKSAGENAQAQVLARSLADVSRTRDFPIKTVRVDEKQMVTVKQQIKQVRDFRTERAKIDLEAAREMPKVKSGDVKSDGRTAAVKVKTPELPRLSTAVASKGTQAAPPASLRSPDASTKVPAVVEPKGKARTLPDPEEILRSDPKTGRPTPKGKIDPPMKGDRPVKVDPPPKKSPPVKADPPPKKDPPVKADPPPKKDPPKKDKDKDKDG